MTKALSPHSLVVPKKKKGPRDEKGKTFTYNWNHLTFATQKWRKNRIFLGCNIQTAFREPFFFFFCFSLFIFISYISLTFWQLFYLSRVNPKIMNKIDDNGKYYTQNKILFSYGIKTATRRGAQHPGRMSFFLCCLFLGGPYLKQLYSYIFCTNIRDANSHYPSPCHRLLSALAIYILYLSRFSPFFGHLQRTIGVHL